MDRDELSSRAEHASGEAGASTRAESKPFRRRDGAGHINPEYRAALLRESGRSRTNDEAHAFLDGDHSSSDALAEQLGEGFIETATRGQYEAEDVFDQVVPEENGGPFVASTGRTEYAHGLDASNIAEATREPFPKT